STPFLSRGKSAHGDLGFRNFKRRRGHTVVYTWTFVAEAQLRGMFFAISMFSKTLLSRAPCRLTHSAMAQIPSGSATFSPVPNTRSALVWSENANFTSLRESRYLIRHSLPMA